MLAYTREFLVEAFMSRYVKCTFLTVECLVDLEKMAYDLYDRVGRDQFRVYASLDAQAIQEYKRSL
jgi:hypothetical protein